MDSVSICNLALGFNTCSSCEEQRISPPIERIKLRFNTYSSCEEQPNRFSRVVRYIVSIHAPLARSNITCRKSA